MSSIILFFVGLKDDILIIAPLKKLWGQLLATLVIIILGDVRFTSLHGFLGINHISYINSLLLTFFVFIVIINGFNLIDGIDGLAAGAGILASIIFGIWFYLIGDFEYSIVSATMAGSLIAFFWFNVYSKKHKIFMGDTGSLLVGLFMAVVAVRFNELNITQSNGWFIHAAPAVSFAILLIPLFDTIRVFIIRLFQGRSPFKADTNHVHHRLLALGMSHIRATTYILCSNVIIVLISLLINRLGIIRLMLLNLLLATIFSLLPEIIYFVKEKIKNINS
jgi:UDP-N-acetylmuramyl pentapeptide phosphotransferase/UDP-N-acetylglucosamine-1-phosphate transferase